MPQKNVFQEAKKLQSLRRNSDLKAPKSAAHSRIRFTLVFMAFVTYYSLVKRVFHRLKESEIMYISRRIDVQLRSWRASSQRCPLILRGARQVGKSASVSQLAKEFDSFAELDFELRPELKEVFSGSLEPSHLLMQLEAISGQKIQPGKTLVFFDEIQECPRALQSLRYFKEKLPELHVIAAGSLLEFALGEVSFPVGRVDYRHLYPMSFDEFLIGTGRENLLKFIPKMRLQGIVQSDVPSAMAKLLSASLREYMIVGGMPEAVKTFSQTRSIVDVTKIHDRLLRSFRDDIPKYANGQMQRSNVSQIFSRVPQFCGQQITFTKIYDDDPKRNKLSLSLLRQALLVHFVRAASPASLPLGATSDDKTFKPVFIDIGLAQRLCGRNPAEVLHERDVVTAFDGQLAEQFVGQQLLATSDGSECGELYYWKRHEKSSSAEVDYLLSNQGKVVPLEVKGGKSGSLKSLHLLLKTYLSVNSAICLQDTEKVTQEGKICFAPLYSDFGVD